MLGNPFIEGSTLTIVLVPSLLLWFSRLTVFDSFSVLSSSGAMFVFPFGGSAAAVGLSSDFAL